MIKTKMLNITFEVLSDAIDPELSKMNQDKIPVRTVFRTCSGALSYTQQDKHQIITPQPNRNPPVNADKNLVSDEAYVVVPSIGQLNRSRVSLAGSRVDAMVPKKKTGPKEPITTAVIFSQNL